MAVVQYAAGQYLGLHADVKPAAQTGAQFLETDTGDKYVYDGVAWSQISDMTVTVTGALTDAQLRATAVPVSGPVTDTQLRAAAVPVTPAAGEFHLGEVGGNTDQITPTLAVQATPDYSSGDVVGTGFAGSSNGILRLDNAMRVSGGKAVLQSLLVIDRSNQKQPLSILFFDSLPTDTYTDNSVAPTISTTDSARLIRKVNVAAADYETIGGLAVADISAIGKVVKANGTAHLYAVLVATATINFAATTDLTLRMGLLRD